MRNRIVGWMVVAIMFSLFATVNAQSNRLEELLGIDSSTPSILPSEKVENPLSAWIRLDINLQRGRNAVGRCAEVFLTKGDFAPFDIYYFDTGDGSYQETGITVGFKAFNAFGLDFWALPYFVAASDSEYFGPCLWINGGWGRWKFNSLPMYYIPLGREGTRQFTTCNTYLNYEINKWLQIGVGGNAYWADTGKDEWSWRLGPNMKIKDPFTILPGGKGDFTIRTTWDQDGEWALFLQKTFTF